ncbi:hypothetical protein OMAG_002725 [Candidatus Omnitrophus magneticus]|uniref:Uncharacterized protein n=1 Tax=Candidatus Omnitrophus magneticus TaxID=1609969 RepID=A0A0F0CJK0_9BACT|nr:hypothetical protein OMAG_002725 [Candidatus Omnitrophus magneticus]
MIHIEFTIGFYVPFSFVFFFNTILQISIKNFGNNNLKKAHIFYELIYKMVNLKNFGNGIFY